LQPTELTNRNYKIHLLRRAKILLGKNKAYQYSLVEMSNKKWPRNESDPKDNECELPIFKYDTLVEQKERTPEQEEVEPITPSQFNI